VVLGPAFIGFEGRRNSRTRRCSDDVVHRHGNNGFYGIGESVVFLFWELGAKNRTASRAARIACRHWTRLIAMTPLIDIFGMPLVGLISLGLILYTLVAGIKLPYKIPGVFASVAIGTVLYYLLGSSGIVGGTYTGPPLLSFISVFHGQRWILSKALALH